MTLDVAIAFRDLLVDFVQFSRSLTTTSSRPPNGVFFFRFLAFTRHKMHVGSSSRRPGRRPDPEERDDHSRRSPALLRGPEGEQTRALRARLAGLDGHQPARPDRRARAGRHRAAARRRRRASPERRSHSACAPSPSPQLHSTQLDTTTKTTRHSPLRILCFVLVDGFPDPIANPRALCVLCS